MALTHETLRPTRQRRSQRSLEKILAALESLIEEKTFAEITVTEICRRASVAVGTFYDRVGSKEGLLEHLRQRIYADVVERLTQAFSERRWRDVELERMLTENAREMVALHRERQGALRAIIVEARRSPEFAAHAMQLNDVLMRIVGGAWLSHRDRFRSGDPEQLVRHAFLMAAGYLREAVIWDELWPAHDRDDDAVAAALAHLLIAFLIGPASLHAQHRQD